MGAHVTIANDVLFATHNASANFYLEGVSDLYGRINIGNYVFIGVVVHNFNQEGVVIGGNPAKIIGRVSDLKEKNKHRRLMTWGMTFEEKRQYLLAHEDQFK